MGKNCTIEWTDHTFNPWWGCSKVSEACEHCYAEAWSKRVGSSIWGPKAERRFFGDAHWSEPKHWNTEAEELGRRKKVFCASMADVFEDRKDLMLWRSRLWELIEGTPWLDWLLLTKRPDNVRRMVPWESAWPQNVWLGTTVENQRMADRRIPVLLKYPAVIRFVSCEPLLGPLNLAGWLQNNRKTRVHRTRSSGHQRESCKEWIEWVIVGGESGPRARPMDPLWVQSIRDQCLSSNIPFNFKQWGNWRPLMNTPSLSARVLRLKSASGKVFTLARMGKKRAGRVLDGKTWDEVPLK